MKQDNVGKTFNTVLNLNELIINLKGKVINGQNTFKT